MCAVKEKELSNNMCGFYMAGGWYCSEPKFQEMPHCFTHAYIKCWEKGCDNSIHELCEQGYIYCDKHGCANLQGQHCEPICKIPNCACICHMQETEDD